VRVLLNCYQMTEIDGCYSDYVDHIIIIVIMGAHRQRAWSGHVERWSSDSDGRSRDQQELTGTQGLIWRTV